jgi:predicted dehydrogenase
MINYAVVGAGRISQEAFLPGVGQSGNSRVGAIVTGDRAKAARLADFYDVGAVVDYEQYDALLTSPAIDAVYIALPNHMHADFTIRAARAGKHILVEKPLAASEDEALAMIAAARSANVFLMTAYRLHNEPGTVAVLEHIRADAIGRPLFFQSVFSFQAVLGNHRLKATTWGRPLQDIGVLCRPSHLRGRTYRGHGDGAPAGRRPALWRSRSLGGCAAAISLGRPRAIRR